MSNSAWDQFKKTWVSFLMTLILGVSSFTAYKVDKFVDKVNSLERNSIIKTMVDSIQTISIIELKANCKVLQADVAEMKMEHFEAVLPKNKYKPE